MPPRSPLSYDPYGLLPDRASYDTSQLPEDKRLALELSDSPTISKAFSNAMAGQDYGAAVYDENEAIQGGDIAAMENAEAQRRRFRLRQAASTPDGSQTLSGAMEKGDWGNFVQNTLGQTGYSMLPSVGAGALGALAGTPFGKAGQLVAGLGAAGLSSYFQNRAGNAGQISHDEQLNSLTPEQKNQMASRTALVQAPLDAATALIGPLGKVVPGIAKAGMGTRVAGGALGEGATEGAQDLVFQKAGQQYFPEREIDTTSLMDNAAAGVLGGGAMSAIGLNAQGREAAPRTDGVDVSQQEAQNLPPELIRANYNSDEEFEVARAQYDIANEQQDLGAPADASFMGRMRSVAEQARSKFDGLRAGAQNEGAVDLGTDLGAEPQLDPNAPVDLGGPKGRFDTVVERAMQTAAKYGIDEESLSYAREAIAHVAGQTKERSTAVIQQALELAKQGGLDSETVQQISSAVAKAAASETKRAAAAAKVKGAAMEERGLSGMARDTLESIKSAAEGVKDYSATAMSEMLLRGDAFPDNIGATVEETQANIAASRGERVRIANAMSQTLQQDEAIPDAVKRKIASLGEITEENVDTAGSIIGVAMQTAIAAEKVTEKLDKFVEASKSFGHKAARATGDKFDELKDAVVDSETGGKIFGRRNNLMGGNFADLHAMQKIAFEGLTDEAKQNDAVLNNLQTITNAVAALALRTGHITPKDIAIIADVQNGMEIFENPAQVVADILSVVAEASGKKYSFANEVLSVRTATKDVADSGGTSFAIRMARPGIRAKGKGFEAIANYIDQAIVDMSRERKSAADVTRNSVFADALKQVYVSPERVSMVLEYYMAEMQDAMKITEDGLIEQPVVDEDLTLDEVDAVEEESQYGEGGMNLQESSGEFDRASYMYNGAKGRPFLTADAKGISDAKREAVATGRLGPDVEAELVGMDEYTDREGGNPDEALAKIRKDVVSRLDESLGKLAGSLGYADTALESRIERAMAAARSNEPLTHVNPKSKEDLSYRRANIRRLAGELSMLDAVRGGEGGTAAALKLYSVLQLGSSASADAVASDKDIADMAVIRGDRDTKTDQVRFFLTNGDVLVLNAGSMVTVGKRSKDIAVKGQGEDAFARTAFANALSSVLNRKDVEGLKDPDMLEHVVIKTKKDAEKNTVRQVTAGPVADIAKIAGRLEALGKFKDKIVDFKERLAKLKELYIEADEIDYSYRLAKPKVNPNAPLPKMSKKAATNAKKEKEEEDSRETDVNVRADIEQRIEGFIRTTQAKLDAYYEWVRAKKEAKAKAKESGYWSAYNKLENNPPELTFDTTHLARWRIKAMNKALEDMREIAFENRVIAREGENAAELGTQGESLDVKGERTFDESGELTSSGLLNKRFTKSEQNSFDIVMEERAKAQPDRADPLNGLTGRERLTAVSRLMYSRNRTRKQLADLEAERTVLVKKPRLKAKQAELAEKERALVQRISAARARAEKAEAAYEAVRLENIPLELSPEQMERRGKKAADLKKKGAELIAEFRASGMAREELTKTSGALEKAVDDIEAAKTPGAKAFEAKLAAQNEADKREKENAEKPRKYNPLEDKGADVAAERAALEQEVADTKADAAAKLARDGAPAPLAPRTAEAKFKPFERKSLASKKPEGVGFKLTHTGMYTAKDQKKADQATAFIGRGSEKSSTNQYRKDAEAAGIPVNAAKLSVNDVVFISAEGNRVGRLKPQKGPIDAAISAGATILTDNSQNRARNHNIGEREVAAYLTSQGYEEVSPGRWNKASKDLEGDEVVDTKGTPAGKPSGMSPRRGRPLGKKALNAEGRKILAEIQRIRGKDIKLRMRQLASAMGGSGEYYKILMSDGTIDRVIEIAVNAANPMSVAWHESLHDFFATLNPSHRSSFRVKRDLNAVSGSIRVRKQLEKLLEGHPKALAQLNNAEERTAYMYQFWAAGLLEVNPKAAGWLEDIRRFFKDVLGMVTQTERAEDLLQALHDGRFAEPNTVAYVVADMKGSSTMDKIESVSPAIADALRALGNAAPDRLRAFQNEHLDALADKFSSEEGSLGFIQNRARKVGFYSNKLDKVLAGTTNEQRAVALQNLQAMKKPSNDLERGIADYLKEMYEYMSKSGVQTAVTTQDPITGKGSTVWEPLRRVAEGYFPRHWNAKAIQNNMAEWKALLKQHSNMDAAAIERITKSILEGTGQIELAESRHALGFTPYALSAQERGFKFITPANADAFTKFQSDNLADILVGYTNQAVHRAEYAKEFGNDGEQINEAVKAAKLSAPQQEKAWKAIGALEGTLGSNKMSRSTMELMSNVMTLQNVVLLPLTIFSQMIDPIVLAARSGKLSDAGTAYVEAIKALKNAVTKSPDKTIGRDMAELIGIVHNDSVLEAMGAAWGSTHMGAGARHVNRMFFKYNGMQGWNNVMRSVATHAGAQYIMANKDNKEVLSELGLTSKDVKVDADGQLDLSSDKVKQAMFRFVDQAVLRPSASQRPVWMSDPRFMLVGHLKQFVFAMQNVVLKRANEQLELGNMKPWGILALAMPAILAADIAKGALTGSTQMNGWGFMDYLSHAVARSGLLGVGDFGTQVFDDAERGRLPGEGLIGPAGEHLAKILRFVTGSPDVDMADVINRTIPGARFVN